MTVLNKHDPSTFTDEQKAVYDQMVRDAAAARINQPWVQEYLSKPMTTEGLAVLREWVLEMPPQVQQLLLRFPPGCLVSTKPGVKLAVPQPGTCGFVVSYSDDATELSVMQSPDATLRACCKVGELILVGCPHGTEPEDIRRILENSK